MAAQTTKTGHFALADLIANKQTLAADFDQDTITQVFQASLDAHNALLDGMLALLAEPTTDRLRLTGSADTGYMVEVDEHGRVPTQAPSVGDNVGIPLKKFDFGVGWTWEWMEMNTVGDMALALRNAEKAHVLKVMAELKRALFLTTNYDFTDRYETPKVVLPVKRLANADGFALPDGPNGEAFTGSSHQHYLANATLTAAFLTSLTNTIYEHYSGAELQVAFNSADEATVRALTGFSAYVQSGIQLSTASNQPTQRLNVSNTNNRAIGLFNGAEIWIKPWGIANYALAYAVSGAPKPLAYRQPKGGRTGLRTMGDIKAYPFQTRYMSAKFGFGVQERTSAAALYFANGTWSDPTITG
jgi:hypothetical protein